MITKNRGNPPFERLNSLRHNQQLDIKTSAGDDKQTLTRVSIRIPKTYRSQPVISHLVSHHGLMVNIRAAVVRAHERDDGWFDLELRGRTEQIRSALDYLYELAPDVYLEVWQKANPQENRTFQSAHFNSFDLAIVPDGVASKFDSPTQSRIKIQIPMIYHQQPVLSHLTSNYGLTVYITGALLGGSSQEDGLFDLELQGTPQQIQKALAFLNQLNIKIWGKANPDGDSWEY